MNFSLDIIKRGSVVLLVMLSIILYCTHRYGNVFFMRFFRNISRYKSRKRLYGQYEDVALLPILFGKEEKLNITLIEGSISLQRQNSTGESVFYVTLEDLAAMNGSDEETPMWIAVNDYVFDVTKGKELYGPGKAYGALVGRNATLAYANACFEEKCFIDDSSLTFEDLEDVNNWLEFYITHDKYQFIGKLISNPVDVIIEAKFYKRR